MIYDEDADSTASSPAVSYDAANCLFMIFSTFAILFMIQGAGLFYSGLSRRKSALIQAANSLIGLSIVSVQWIVIGYSFVYGKSASHFIGGFSHVLLHDILPKTGQDRSELPISPRNGVPEVGNALFAGMFPSVTCALTLGATSARGSIKAALLFVLLWTTVVYDPIAFWTWNKNGWAHNVGSVDYAGGAIVHITSGFSALAYAFMLGPRLEPAEATPHNSLLVVLGTFFMWVGWFGFNAGSAYAANGVAILAMLATQISASIGGLTWAYMDYRLDRTWSIVGFCSGIVSGLVCVTSGAGFIPLWAAFLFGLCGGMASNFATKLKFYMKIDDSLDVFAVHGIGGFVGMILTGIFANFTDQSHPLHTKVSGLLYGNPMLLLYQLMVAIVTALYAFVVTCAILFIINKCDLRLRVSREKELLGLDSSEHDEMAYDYHEIIQELDSVLYQRRHNHNNLNHLHQEDDGNDSDSFLEPSQTGLFTARTESSPLLG